MKLRTYILMILLLFALTPMVLLLAFGLPPVLDRLQIFYQQAHLQQLRADFRDLDQHMASRQALTGVVAKLPEPGLIVSTDSTNTQKTGETRLRYTEWINRLFGKSLDIISINFLDENGTARFWLERDKTAKLLKKTPSRPDMPGHAFLTSVLNAGPSAVLVSPIYTIYDEHQRRLLRLYIASAIRDNAGKATAMVIITVDPGGLARAYRDTLWVQNDGSYLYTSKKSPAGKAFEDFPGLEKILQRGRIGLWSDDEEHRMFWVPMFRTENNEPLWVGRIVDESPLASLLRSLLITGAIVSLLVLFGVWLLTNWFADRLDRISKELGSGVQRIVEDNEEVKFAWDKPQELHILAENLTHLASTHARNNRNLRTHTRQLEQSNRFKTEFLANVSHELKTPLNSIMVLSKILREDAALPSEQQQKAGVIHHAGRDLLGLIDNILELSRIESLDEELKLEEINLRQLLDDTIALMHPQFEEKGLSLKLEYATDTPSTITSDSDKIRQILKNLLSNAVKFTSRGGITIAVKMLFNADYRGQPLHITVSDSGIGIPDKQQKHIFEAFRQADGSIRRRFGGTGLGLNISRRLAALLGGHLEVTSSENSGSTFTLALPLEYYRSQPAVSPGQQEPLELENEQTTTTVAASALPAADFSDQTVVLVEDNIDTMLQLTQIMSQWGITVIAATDDDEIREVLREEPECLLIIINSRICDANNCDSISIIQNEKTSGTIIAIAEDCTLINEELVQAASDCLTTPINALQLKSIIDETMHT
ncbi:MAG: ATP-binding protein [Pseudomonadota bacterium]|nr:ATP-binding protein [Pseudomonadota bacterium]